MIRETDRRAMEQLVEALEADIVASNARPEVAIAAMAALNAKMLCIFAQIHECTVEQASQAISRQLNRMAVAVVVDVEHEPRGSVH